MMATSEEGDDDQGGRWDHDPIPRLVLATLCAPVACGTISAVRPTVLIVDDNTAFRSSARELIKAEGFDVIGEASDGAEAVDAVATLRPDIVLLDVQLPGLDGLAVAEQLASAPDPPAVVLISSRDAAAYGPRLRETPARGFIPKSALSGEALAALVG
jgi:DNA-binding NarL/FixJ family response regulator